MSDEKNIEACIKDKGVWMRLLYMILFAILYSIAEVVIFAVVVYQFLTVLFTGNKDERILKLGQSLSLYVCEVFQFLTFNSETKPYPMGEWPVSKLSIVVDEPKPDMEKENSKS
ncbi:MAG: DUF4389 domain-containing protein [Ghiorsea sp.]|nr:DUF4389 domain-containing protein [Ghiorsea sp.]